MTCNYGVYISVCVRLCCVSCLEVHVCCVCACECVPTHVACGIEMPEDILNEKMQGKVKYIKTLRTGGVI